MPERRWPRRAATAICAYGLLLGCASAPPPEADLASVLPQAESELSHAPPAARDALAEGLRWIVLDAPGTNATRRDPVARARTELSTEDITEPDTLLPTAAPIAAAAVEPVGPSPGRSASNLYVTLGQLNLRQGPGVDQTILAVLQPGTEVTGLDISGEWLRVATPTRGEGWVHRDWLGEYLWSERPAGSADAASASGQTASGGAEP